MLKDGAYLQAYNAQVVVDEHAQVIVAEGVSNQAPDQQHLVPMLRDVFGNCGDAPRKMTADNGYPSATNIEFCDNNQIDAHIAVGPEHYARRKSIVEPALGQIKAARGFRRFSLRSFFKVRAEGTLVCLTHNLLELYRSKLATVASV